jgi:hypothetical protein
VNFIGFDGSGTHLDFLRVFFNDSRFTFHHAAVTNAAGAEVAFPRVELGEETGMAGYGEERVPQTTLDAAVGHLQYIDVLMTDAEGMDLHIGLGARKLFHKQKVGMYIFEVHKIKGNKLSLRGHIEWLNRRGMTCYWAIHGRNISRRVARMSGGCFFHSYESTRGWYNVVCVNRNFPELRDVMNELEQTPKDEWFHECSLKRQKRAMEERWQAREESVSKTTLEAWRWVVEGAEERPHV